MFDERARKFGLPESLLVPIAARSLESIELYVGKIIDQIKDRSGRVSALAVAPHRQPPKKEASTPIWFHAHSFGGDFTQEYPLPGTSNLSQGL